MKWLKYPQFQKWLDPLVPDSKSVPWDRPIIFSFPIRSLKSTPIDLIHTFSPLIKNLVRPKSASIISNPAKSFHYLVSSDSVSKNRPSSSCSLNPHITLHFYRIFLCKGSEKLKDMMGNKVIMKKTCEPSSPFKSVSLVSVKRILGKRKYIQLEPLCYAPSKIVKSLPFCTILYLIILYKVHARFINHYNLKINCNVGTYLNRL